MTAERPYFEESGDDPTSECTWFDVSQDVPCVELGDTPFLEGSHWPRTCAELRVGSRPIPSLPCTHIARSSSYWFWRERWSSRSRAKSGCCLQAWAFTYRPMFHTALERMMSPARRSTFSTHLGRLWLSV